METEKDDEKDEYMDKTTYLLLSNDGKFCHVFDNLEKAKEFKKKNTITHTIIVICEDKESEIVYKLFEPKPEKQEKKQEKKPKPEKQEKKQEKKPEKKQEKKQEKKPEKKQEKKQEKPDIMDKVHILSLPFTDKH